MIFSLKLDILIAILAAAGIYFFYYGKNLLSPKKELLSLKLSVLCLVGFVIVGFITEPYYAYYIDTSPTHIQTIDDARTSIQRSNETIERLLKDLRESTRMVTATLLLLGCWVLPSFLRLSDVLVLGKNERADDHNDNLISIFNDDKS